MPLPVLCAYRCRVDDLRLLPGPGLPDGLVIPDAELVERFSHASGPGGQAVNTADSRVQLSFDLATTRAFTDLQRSRALHRLASRLDGTVVTIEAAEFRSQHRNRIAARERLAELLRAALAPPPPPRRPTRPSRGSVDRRLNSKTKRGQLKRQRRAPTAE
ncbi:ribosome-associated protein [Propionicimonas paludicola]|uniref:Ribosome-associated protein n=1 Tax=Propionicimonas paludicola TaxID=185243 RepID=A0A2A9CQX0_9ACTN|nr:ribosome-associated protein [Propionicimonas paludicola]